MDDRNRIALVIVGSAMLASGAVIIAGWWGSEPVPSILVSVLAVAGAFGMVWRYIDRNVTETASLLAESVEELVRNPDRPEPFPPLPPHVLGRLPGAVHALAETMRSRRLDLNHLLRRTEGRLEERREWLEVALRDLSEAVLVCDLNHQVLFHNAAAIRIIGRGRVLEPGRPLDTMLAGSGISHALDCLEARRNALSHMPRAEIGAVSFIGVIPSGKTVLRGRMSLVLGGKRKPTGYVVTLSEVNEEWAAEPGQALRQAVVRDLRGPLGALSAAAEALASFPAMSAEDRGRFVTAINEECARIGHRIETLSSAYPDSALSIWPIADIHFSELFACIAHSLESRLDIKLTMVGIPLWLRGDSHSLMEAFLALFASLHVHTGCREFDLECMLGDRRIYLDINWIGETVADSRLTSWLATDVSTPLGPQKVRDILERHGSEPWSLSKRDGVVAIRIPLPLPRRPQFRDEDVLAPPGDPSLNAASETSLKLLDRNSAVDFRRRPLDRVPFVVLHAEAAGTGEIVAVGAVRVEDGRLLTVGTFERRSKDPRTGRLPSLESLNTQLHAFAGTAVLAVHDVPRCLPLLGIGSGPVIDTMLLSRLLDPGEEDHSLEAVAARLGISLSGHRSEVGHAMASAELLLRQIDLLKAIGILQYGDLVTALTAGQQIGELVPQA